jgi:hypothetical protein
MRFRACYGGTDGIQVPFKSRPFLEATFCIVDAKDLELPSLTEVRSLCEARFDGVKIACSVSSFQVEFMGEDGISADVVLMFQGGAMNDIMNLAAGKLVEKSTSAEHDGEIDPSSLVFDVELCGMRWQEEN